MLMQLSGFATFNHLCCEEQANGPPDFSQSYISLIKFSNLLFILTYCSHCYKVLVLDYETHALYNKAKLPKF